MYLDFPNFSLLLLNLPDSHMNSDLISDHQRYSGAQLTQGDERGRQPDEVSDEGDDGEDARHSVPVLDVERIQHGHKPSIPHGLGEQQATSEKNRR